MSMITDAGKKILNDMDKDSINIQATDIDNLFNSIKNEVMLSGDCLVAIAELPTTEDSEKVYCATIYKKLGGK